MDWAIRATACGSTRRLAAKRRSRRCRSSSRRWLSMDVIAGGAARSPRSRPAGSSPHPDSASPLGRVHHGAICAPSGRGQHGRDGDRDGAGTPGEAAADRDDRTNGSASSLAGAARPERRRRARSPSRRPPANHPPAAAVNHDASLFLAASPHVAFQRQRRRNFGRASTRVRAASPDTGPSGRHASRLAPTGLLIASACLGAASGDAPVRRNRRRSRSARGRSSGTRPPGSHTARTGTDGQTPARPARHRRRGVDERHPWQDTRPAFVLPARCGARRRDRTARFESGAVLALKSGRLPAACRGARCRLSPAATPHHRTPSGPDHADTRAMQMPPPRHNDGARPGTAARRDNQRQ